MNSDPVFAWNRVRCGGFWESTWEISYYQWMHKSPFQSQHRFHRIHLCSVTIFYRWSGPQSSALSEYSRELAKKVPFGQRDSMDNLPWVLVDKEPETLISEPGLSYYPLHSQTEEEAMSQCRPSSFLAGNGYGSSVKSGLVAVPPLRAHVHEAFQSQLVPSHDDLFHAVLPSQVSRYHTHEPTRQNTIRRRRKIDTTERAENRTFYLEHREFKQQQIAYMDHVIRKAIIQYT